MVCRGKIPETDRSVTIVDFLLNFFICRFTLHVQVRSILHANLRTQQRKWCDVVQVPVHTFARFIHAKLANLLNHDSKKKVNNVPAAKYQNVRFDT